MTLVSKANGDPRCCVNYIRLNKLTVDMKFPLPTVDDVAEFVRGAQWLTTVDLCWAYQHVPMREKDIEKTAFITEDGHFELTRMIFGFKNAPAWFQSLMRRLLWSLKSIVFVYIDDLLIRGDSKSDLMKNLRSLFDLLRKVSIKFSQCTGIPRPG